MELLADHRKLAVMGFAEVAARLPYFFRLFSRVRSEMVSRGTDLVIPIDYPGFNLRLARAAHAASIPVLYYIAPQVWAWHLSRMRQMAEHTARVAVVLPFEEPLFREAGARATYVGHPLLDAAAPVLSREALCRQVNLRTDRPILAVFPGSRAQEVVRHMEVFVETARRVRARRPEIQPVIAVSDAVPAHLYEGLPFPRTTESRSLLHHARAALVKSGTTTLEAALAGTPMVIAYKTSPLTYQLARRLVRVDHIGLVNLVMGERLVPEFVQGDATPAKLTDALEPLVDPKSAERQAMVAGLTRVREILAAGGDGAPNAAGRVVELADELLSGAA